MFNHLKKATLIKRYKRFLADVSLENGEVITIYCPNTGAMTNCATEGDTVFYSESKNLKRKYKFTWELTLNAAGDLICIHSALANQIVEGALKENKIDALVGYSDIKPEVKYGSENSRIDFLLTDANKEDCYVEVKSCTLLDENFGRGQGFFPDAVSVRGQKHLRELLQMKSLGHRSVLVFAVLHTGITSVKAASHIDAKYAQLFDKAKQQGVEIVCYFAPIAQLAGEL
jgi:sugar fermentation stimulation protein A